MLLKYCGLFLILNTLPRPAENRLYTKVQSVDCNAMDATFGEFDYCNMKRVSKDISEFSMRLHIIYKSVTNCQVYNALYRRKFFKSPILEWTIDACAFMRNKRRNPFAQRVYDFLGLGTHSNINHSCPFKNDLIIDKLRWDNRKINLFTISPGEYNLSTTWIVSEKKRVTVSCGFKMSTVY